MEAKFRCEPYRNIHINSNGEIVYYYGNGICMQVNPARQVLYGAVFTDETGRQHHFRDPHPQRQLLTANAVLPRLNSPPGRGLKFFSHEFDDSWGTYAPYHFEIRKPDGTQIHFKKAGAGLSPPDVSIVDRRGRTTRIVRDSSGFGRQITSGHGRSMTLIGEGPGGRINKIIDPAGNQTLLDYDESGDLIRITDANSNSIEYEYDEYHRMTRETLKNGSVYTVDYMPQPEFNEPPDGGMATTNGSGLYPGPEPTRLIPRRVIRDGMGNTIAQVVSSNGFPGRRGQYAPEGAIEFTDADGNTWIYHRDDVGRIVQIDDPEGHSREFAYGQSNDPYVPPGPESNRLIRRYDESGSFEQYEYDKWGNVTQRQDAGGNSYNYVYDKYGPVKSHVLKKMLPGGELWEYEYNDKGDLTKIIDPIYGSSNGISFIYQEYAEDDAIEPGIGPLPGRVKTITRIDRDGHQRFYEYDTQGNLTKITRAAGVLNLVTRYEYNVMGRLTREIVERGDREVVTRWTYDSLSRLTTNTVDSNGLSLTTRYEYDAYGNLTNSVDAKSHVVAFEYDSRNRLIGGTLAAGDLDLTSRWQLDGNSNVTHTEDANSNGTDFLYNRRNELIQTTDAEGFVTQLEYDSRGNLTQSRQWQGVGMSGSSRTVDLAYDTLYRLTTTTVAAGTANAMSTAYTYEPAGGGGCACGADPASGLPHKIVDPAGKVTYVYYDAMNRVTRAVRKVGDASDNEGDDDDVVTLYTYDMSGNLVSLDGPEGERVEFAYDEAGRRTAMTAIASNGDDLVTRLTYDGAGNVIETSLPNGNVIQLAYERCQSFDAGVRCCRLDCCH